MTEQDIVMLHKQSIENNQLDNFFSKISHLSEEELSQKMKKLFSSFFYHLGLKSAQNMKSTMLLPQFSMQDLGLTFHQNLEHKCQYLANIISYVQIIKLSSIPEQPLKKIHSLVSENSDIKKLLENIMINQSIDYQQTNIKNIKKI